MTIKVNGTPQEIETGLTVTDLLVRNKVEQPDMVSVQLNGEFVQRDRFAATVFQEGDGVDFLYFMGGGRQPMSGFTTRAVHAPFLKKDPHGALHMPVYDSVSFEFETAEETEEAFVGKRPRHTYTRTTNPQLEVADIGALAAIAGWHKILLIADTTATPLYFFNSKHYGVDIEVLSSTKYVSAGATTVGDIIIDNGTYNWGQIPNLEKEAKQYGPFALLMKLKREVHRNLGACLSPHHEVAARFFGERCGALVTFDLSSQQECFTFLNKLKLVRWATNIHDNRTLALHPASIIFCEYPADLKRQMGAPETLIRLAVGIEDVEDLIADLAQALED